MRIIVPIKQVPETNAVQMDERTGTMIREGVEAIINPLDLYAIEIAIRLREQLGASDTCGAGILPAQTSKAGGTPAPHEKPAGGTPAPQTAPEVVAISMGPPKAMSALREAIAMGADSAVLVSDRAFAGSDTWATSYVLAAAIRKLLGGTVFPDRARTAASTAEIAQSGMTVPPNLIICGERATDGDTGQVGPGIASFLDLPAVTYVSRIERIEGRTARVHRLVEDGYEVLDVDLPAVLTVVKEIADPRLPTLRGKQKAKRAEVPTWTAADLGVEPGKVGLDGSPTRVVRIFRPTVARKGRKINAGDDSAVAQAADELVAFLRQRELL